MWTIEHSIATTASPEAIWRLWSEVATWPDWNGDIARIEISGPFAVGSTISVTPIGEDTVELRIADVSEPDLFVDEAGLGNAVVRTVHRDRPARRRSPPRQLSDADDGPGRRRDRPSPRSSDQLWLPRDAVGARRTGRAVTVAPTTTAEEVAWGERA
jgi:hypothetical protein